MNAAHSFRRNSRRKRGSDAGRSRWIARWIRALPALAVRCSRMPCRIALGAGLLLSACAGGSDEATAAYRAACEGPPLRNVQQRNQALEDGYAINRRYDCIDKDSYRAVAEQQARWAAANTPATRAQREAEFAQQRARDEAERAQRAQEEARQREAEAAPPMPLVLHDVDANRASAAELATVVSLDADVVAQILAERGRRPFRDWADLVSRVTGLSAAQPAVFASVCGLTVNGASLDGAPPDGALAAQLAQRNARRRAAAAGH